MAAGVEYRIVEYGPVPDLATAARLRGIAVDRLLKTMVVRRGPADFVLVLVPGDRIVYWAKLRDHLGVRRLSFADEAEALAATGYRRGAITPFGAGEWPVLVDAAVPRAGEISLGGGERGRAIHIDGADLADAIGGHRVDVTKRIAS